MGRYSNGDAAAFDTLFQRYEARAFAYFVKRTGSPDRAQDLYQEVFLRIHRARHAYDPGRAFAPWFFRIAHHILIDDQRRAFRSKEVSLEEEAQPASPVASDVVAERDQVERLLASLSKRERFVLAASKGAGIGYPEIAAKLGKSVDAVKKIASRAAMRLRRSEAFRAPRVP